MDIVTQELEEEGVKSFADAFTTLYRQSRSGGRTPFLLLDLWLIQFPNVYPSWRWILSPPAFGRMTCALVMTRWPGRVKIRLGWLHSIEDARTRLDGYLSFAKQSTRKALTVYS